MATPLTDLEALQRETQARRLGADLYHEAAAISTARVEALAAVMSRIGSKPGYPALVAEGFAQAMVADTGVRHLASLHQAH